MGVQARLTVYARDRPHAEHACKAGYARAARLEDIFSDYRPDSEAMRLCRAPPGQPVKVSPELFIVFERAIKLSEQCRGAFDVTVGPCVQLWRAARKSRTLPTRVDLARARASIGWEYVKLDATARTVTLLRPNMRLDFGGIAKGYAGDETIAVLRANGISRALFEAGGDIVAGDPPPEEKGWKIRIENAASGAPNPVEIANSAISTSGDTAQFVQIDGVRYSHVIDPRTGQALTNRFAATVLAPNGITSDALSTACCVLGPHEGMNLAREYPGVTAYIRPVDQ